MKLPNGKEINNKIVIGVAAAVALVILVVILLIMKLNGEKTYRNISVLGMVGTVDVFRESIGDNIQVYENMNLQSGDTVTVADKSELDMQLDDDKYVYIEENTKMWLEASGKEEDSKTIIHLSDGATLNRIDQKLSDEASYEVETPNATMAIRGTIVRVEVTKDENGIAYTSYQVLEGEVKLQLHTLDGEPYGEPVIVEQGMQCNTRGTNEFSEVILQKIGGETVEIFPIDYSQLPEEVLEKLVEIKETTGRELYSGSEPITIEQLKEIIVSKQEEVEEEEEEATPVEEVEEEEEIEEVVEEVVEEVEEASEEVEEVEEVQEVVPAAAPVPTPTPDPTPSTPTSYSITFMNGSSVFGTQQIPQGEPVNLPILQPSASGSWKYKTETGYAAFDFTAPATTDITLYWMN